MQPEQADDGNTEHDPEHRLRLSGPLLEVREQRRHREASQCGQRADETDHRPNVFGIVHRGVLDDRGHANSLGDPQQDDADRELGHVERQKQQQRHQGAEDKDSEGDSARTPTIGQQSAHGTHEAGGENERGRQQCGLR